MKKNVLIINLSDEDKALLVKMSEHCRETRSQILRWALRHYAAVGPWMIGSTTPRKDVLGDPGTLVVGPASLETEP